eukprot:gnl/TRDRNA2_/TRDRNA2_198513_c0_seq1.p1 gnl/TRDRNA2_/TRDRNA2_198513_c0~~gnl/TRDRNA2_/TRDRNA2_198513_c0_seq1.p1  ORF type:complete len:138 (+),score=34.01 gnl/TRDRNA2_/TRDRNA2_198513_c0_seq1:97-510(+)
MRNQGPGNWREWRWDTLVVPLFPEKPLPEGQLPLSEVIHLTMRGLQAKDGIPKLKATIQDMLNARPKSPGGRIIEDRISEEDLRDRLKELALLELGEDESFVIFPQPKAASTKFLKMKSLHPDRKLSTAPEEKDSPA